MFWLNIKRVIKAGLVNFWRNGYISVASILIMLITLFAIGSLVFNNALLQTSIAELKQKVDVNVYFITTAKEADILDLKTKLESFPEVSAIEYVSREEALTKFQERHVDDKLILQALEELEDNPLGAVLNIKAKEPSQYESVANYLRQNPALSSDGDPIIDKVNYYQNKVVIDTLNNLISGSQSANAVQMIILVLASIAVTFNTIRLAIYVTREEIGVMRLVGASRLYIQGPFVIVGMLYGLISALLVLVLFYPMTYWYSNFFNPVLLFLVQNNVGKVNLFEYYLANFAEVSLVVVGTGVLLGAISSVLAVRRYLSR